MAHIKNNSYPRDYKPNLSYKNFIPLDIGISKDEAEWLKELLSTPIIEEDNDVEKNEIWEMRSRWIKILNNALQKL